MKKTNQAKTKHVNLYVFFMARSLTSRTTHAKRTAAHAMVSRSGDDPTWQDLEGSESTCHLLANKARDWWLETTDVVFLNSPWLQRSTGRAFRCLWILCHFLFWCQARKDFIPAPWVPRSDKVMARFVFVLMLLAFAKVFWSSLMTSRDSFTNSLLLGCASMMGMAYWGNWQATSPDLWLPAKRVYIRGLLGYTFPILCHCNVHPVVLTLVFASTVGHALLHFQDKLEYTRSLTSDFLLLHIVGFQFCMCCAFGLDFTNRVRAVAAGMLHNADTNDPLESPVAGRSARGFCWLAGMNNWVAQTFFCWVSSAVSKEYPSWMCILDTICLSLPWIVLLCTRCRNCTPFKSDLAFVFFSYAPPAWILFRPRLYQTPTDHVGTDYDELAWFLGGTSLACTSTVFATQAAVQAGCVPFLCLSGCLFVMIIFVASTSLHCESCWKFVSHCGYEIPIVVSLAAGLQKSGFCQEGQTGYLQK